MKAVRIHQFGGPEVLIYEEVPDPQLRKDQVLVRVRACALNHLDVWVRKGLPGVKLPHILGSDIAGEVVEVGEYITGFKAGQRVLLAPMHFCGRCSKCVAGLQNQCREFSVLGNAVDGGNCELIAVPAANVIPIPDHLDFNQAASVPLVFLTAWHMLVTRANVQPGENVLIQAAGSGVGSIGIQVAKLRGARVLATAGSAEKLAKAKELGADEVINYTREDWPKAVKQLTERQGVDVVFEHTGAATWPGSIASLKSGGRLVTCGATSGFDARTDIRQIFYRQLTILGSFMGAKAELLDAMKFVESGRIRAVIDQSLPLADARKAHELMEDRAQFGKLVLVP